MIKTSILIFHKTVPLVTIVLPSPSPPCYKILDKYAEKYGFPRENLTYYMSEVLEDEELTKFD
jgi:hypothetical protein